MELRDFEKRVLEIYACHGEYVQTKTMVLLEDAGIKFSKSQLSKLLRTDKGMAYIEEVQRREGIRVTSIRNRVVEELSALAFSKITDVLDVSPNGTVTFRPDVPELVQKAVKSIKLTRRKTGTNDYEDVLEIQMHDKKGALDSLSNILNLQRRIGEELNKDEEANVMRFVGVNIIGPPDKKSLDEELSIDLSLPLLPEPKEIEL